VYSKPSLNNFVGLLSEIVKFKNIFVLVILLFLIIFERYFMDYVIM